MMVFLRVLAIVVFAILSTLLLSALIVGPELLELLDLISSPDQIEQQKPQTPELPPDVQRYFELKNISCQTLSGDFLIVTTDVSSGELVGLAPKIPQEIPVAESIIRKYNHNQSTKTYIRGDWMKRVIFDVQRGIEQTTIWKTGRIYECSTTPQDSFSNNQPPSCIMHLMNESESEEYYDLLHEMKDDCMHFGKTELPPHPYVNLTSLLFMNKTGVLEIDSYRCENFEISANKTYAEYLLSNKSQSELGSGGFELSDKQRAFLWALKNLKGPVTECLDESTGIIVYRNLTIDLTDSYLFDFQEDGYIKANQQTTLEYFTDHVPEHFLALPE